MKNNPSEQHQNIPCSHLGNSAATLFRPFWACLDVDIEESPDCPPPPTTIEEEMNGIHDSSQP